MFCRVALHEKTPGSVASDDARGFRNWVKEQPGFVDGYHVQDSETGRMLSISIWESKESMEALREHTPPGGSVGIVTEAAHREAPEAPETVGEGREGTGPSLAEAPRRAPRNRGGVGSSGSNREESDVVEILRKISEANSMTVSEAAAFLDGPRDAPRRRSELLRSHEAPTIPRTRRW